MNVTSYHEYFHHDITLLNLFPVGIVFILLGAIFILTDHHLTSRLLLSENEESPEDIIHFIYKGDKFSMSRENKEQFDALPPRARDIIAKNIKRSMNPRDLTQKEAATNLNKFSNKKEDREAVL